MARKMKDSGIEWIGEIPADFSLYKLKYLLSSPLCYGANESGTLYSDILPRYIRITDISPNGTLKNSGMLSLDESSAQNYMLHEGDILFARSGATVGKSFIYHNYYGRAAYAGYLIKASFNRLVLPEFVYYYTCSSAYEIWKNSIFIQSTIQNIGADRYSNLPISVPNSIDKQLRIVRYLNNFCSKFDAIVYNLQTSIEDYKKLKQAVITQAITKGVRGEREMKDSGVAWIGEIPKEWVCEKIKYATSISRGLFNHRPRNDERYYNGKYPFIQTGDVANATKYIVSYSQTLNELGKSVSKEFPKGTLTMTIAANVGDVAILNFDAYFPDSVVGFVPNKNIRTLYLFYVFSAMKDEFIRTAIKSTQLNLNIDRVKETFIPVTLNVNEQCEIENYLESKCAEIDGLIAKKEQLVKELESYKKSLIYEVVTGKREV